MKPRPIHKTDKIFISIILFLFALLIYLK